MEDVAKSSQSSANVPAIIGKSKLRYPLRSDSKLKQDRSSDAAISSSLPKRVRSAANVSKSVNVLDLSGKDKSSAKPPRRLSIPVKSAISPHQKLTSSITPISEARVRRSTNSEGKGDTPLSDVSKSCIRRRYNLLSSASHWLSQIKLSECAAKHSISLGFFKLAIEAGCTPLHLLRDELKSYARRHNLDELRDMLQALFEMYDISETLEHLKVSETYSQAAEDGTPFDEVVHSSNSTARTRDLKSKSLNIVSSHTSTVKESSKKKNIQSHVPATRIRASVTKISVSPKSAIESGGHNLQKKAHKLSKKETNNGQVKVMKQEMESTTSEVSGEHWNVETVDEDKENMDVHPTEVISVAEGS
ncbi:hypothetical protein Nepgr_003187 [Nepenthes gracilis]|uniref:Uncharacterized protein n=1 Tax=Nepenthes gracilis TaxID=150966 RepID=A0AAD3XD46_NEPGR|nr:hypothetical protein Nepgr_003187 [Nepenthes gracilis]